MKMTPSELPEEVKTTLVRLKAMGIKIAIGSSSKNAGLILQRLGLQNFFDAVSDGNNITHSKPDPEVFLKAAGMLGEIPAECIVVEDALAGIDAAVAGGFIPAGIGEAAGHPGTAYPLQSLPELLAVLN